MPLLFVTLQVSLVLLALYIQGRYYKNQIQVLLLENEILKHSKPTINDICQLKQTMKILSEATNLLNGNRSKIEESASYSDSCQIQKD